MLKEALRQFQAGRVVMVDDFPNQPGQLSHNTSSKTLTEAPPESFSRLRPVYSKAKRSQLRGLMCSNSNDNIIGHAKAGQDSCQDRPGVGGNTRQGPVAHVAAQVVA
ncbi:hypothetical protein HaLaN_10085, partial [Haematococcus lacustris]